MKKYWIILIASLAVAGVKAQSFSAPDINGNMIYYSMNVNDSLEVVSQTGSLYSGTIIIPDSVDEYTPAAVIRHEVTVIGNNAFGGANLDSIYLPVTIGKIQHNAFYNANLSSITLPKRLKSIGLEAFAGSNVAKVTCLNPVPAELGVDAFYGPGVVRDLYVPTGSVPAYIASPWVNYFASINGEFLGNTNVDDVTASTVDIRWLTDPEVVNYTVSIYTSDTLYRQYEVDSEGHMTRLKMPAIRHLKMDTTKSTTEYFVITLDNLDASTDYAYDISGVNEKGKQIYDESGIFQTPAKMDALLPAEADKPRARKVLHNGQVRIVRDDKRYTLLGQEE